MLRALTPEQSEMQQVEPSRKAWRLQVSVRAMMIVVLAIGAWIGWLTHCARVQRDAVAAITRSGGFVLYDGKMWDPVQSGRGGPFVWHWLVELIGIDYLSIVTEISLNSRATDADLIPIGQLSRLEYLNLSGSQISDAGLRHVRGLTILRRLYLHSTPISDAGLVNLKGLARLEVLTLVDTKITDAGLPYLRGLHRLRELDVPSGVSGSGIRALQHELPNAEINEGLPYK